MNNGRMGNVRDLLPWDRYERYINKWDPTEGVICGFQEDAQNFLEAANTNGLDVLGCLIVAENIYDREAGYSSWIAGGYERSDYLMEERIDEYKEFLDKMLREDTVKKSVKVLEVINEPDLQYFVDGVNLDADGSISDEDLMKMATAYVRTIKATGEAVVKVNSEEGTDYKIAILSLSNIYDDKRLKFADMIFSELSKLDNPEKYFDLLTMHLYHDSRTDDFEYGVFGSFGYERRNQWMGNNVRYLTSLMTGGKYFYPKEKTDVDAVGFYTGQKYDIQNSEDVWHTEMGYSSAPLYDENDWVISGNTGVCVGGEYSQAYLTIRAFNVIKANNINDCLQIYEIADADENYQLKENSFGMLNSPLHNVPYSAKYLYLAVSNYNYMTMGATECVLDQHGSYDTKDYAINCTYKLPDREVHMLYTAWMESETYNIETGATRNIGKVMLAESPFDANAELHYYDLVGNKLSEADVMVDGKYKLTNVPFYVVVGKDIERNTENIVKTEINLLKSNQISSLDDIAIAQVYKNNYEDNMQISLTFKDVDVETDYTGFCVFRLKEEIVDVQPFSGSVPVGEIKNILVPITGVDGKFNKMNVYLFDSTASIMPLCSAYIK